MSVLIRGMEMPREGTVMVVCEVNGQPCVVVRESEPYPLVPVPPHGDLIDRDALPWENQGLMLTDPDEWGLKAWDIEHAPTIIPADKGVKDNVHEQSTDGSDV